MKRPLQHVMEDQSVELVESLVPPEWIVRKLPKDYGVDLEIELVDQGLVTGNRVWVQVKSTQKTTRCSVSFPVPEERPDVNTDPAECVNSIETTTVGI